ncbi:MAG: NUDIX hydrolase [Sphaerobacteraceae bacterium]|nr:MAG: NUDIX hydrolase [Sphaerobacteraceae bacterium]
MRRDMHLTIETVCFALIEGELQVLLVKRATEPFAGSWALPGGDVLVDEPFDSAAQRILSESAGLWGVYLEQLYTFGDPGRDPRGRAVSITYYALMPAMSVNSGMTVARPGRGWSAAEWHRVDQLPGPLAFDHGRIVAYARWRLSQKITYTPLAFHLLSEHFTMSDLRGVYEAIVGEAYDPSNFTRQMLARWDLAPVPGARDRRSRRPARLYRYIGPREIPGGPETLDDIDIEAEPAIDPAITESETRD